MISLKDRLHIQDGDIVITAYAESAAGPGWANTPIWVILKSREGLVHIECLQPDMQTRDMHILYDISQPAHLAMSNAVRDLIDDNPQYPSTTEGD